MATAMPHSRRLTRAAGGASCSEAPADGVTQALIMVAALGLLGYGLIIALRIADIV